MVGSLALAGALTYAIMVLLGEAMGFALNLPGIAGAIVAIGITADSFIIYFERIRDEMRDGRTLRTAIETGWVRSRRTIVVADAVSLLSAVVLFVLAIGAVKGFAFTLGLTTLIDIAVVFFFTKPLVSLLGRTRFFGEGHRFSGFEPDHLGGADARGPLSATGLRATADRRRRDGRRLKKLSRHRLYTGETQLRLHRQAQALVHRSRRLILAICLLAFAIRGLNLGIEFSGGADFQAPDERHVHDRRRRTGRPSGERSACRTTTTSRSPRSATTRSGRCRRSPSTEIDHGHDGDRRRGRALPPSRSPTA